MKEKIAYILLLVLFTSGLFMFCNMILYSHATMPAKKTNSIIKTIIYHNYLVKPERTLLNDYPQESITTSAAGGINPARNLTLASRSDSNRQTLEVTESNYLGKYRITTYCPCEKCNGKWASKATDADGVPIAYGASGNRLNSGYSCAADTTIPFGTKLYIPQIDMTFTVEDRAAKSIEQRYNGQFVDLYFVDHAHYINGASDYMEVYIVE